MMKFVGADEIPHRAQRLDLAAQLRREGDGRPDPQRGVWQPDNNGTRRIRETVKAYVLTVSKPDILVNRSICIKT